jgi:hypothetical protein
MRQLAKFKCVAAGWDTGARRTFVSQCVFDLVKASLNLTKYKTKCETKSSKMANSEQALRFSTRNPQSAIRNPQSDN